MEPYPHENKQSINKFVRGKSENHLPDMRLQPQKEGFDMRTSTKVFLGVSTLIIATGAATYLYMNRKGSSKKPEELIEDAKAFVDEMKEHAEEKIDAMRSPEQEEKIMHVIRDVKKNVKKTIEDVEHELQSATEDVAEKLKLGN